MTVLAGRTALVTGATGHLGRAMSGALAKAGAHVLINGRDPGRCAALAAELRAAGYSSEAAAFDVTDPAAVERFVSERGSETPLNVLVNNAAVGRGGTIETSVDQDYVEAFDIAVLAAQRLIRHLLPALRAARARDGDASVVNISSMYGLVSPDLRAYDAPGSSNPPFYGAAKAALVQLTRYAACQFGSEGIRFNAIAPGPFPGPAAQQTLPAMVERLTSRVPLGRIGQPDEMGGPLVFLASPMSSFVTGIVLPVDGGWTAW